MTAVVGAVETAVAAVEDNIVDSKTSSVEDINTSFFCGTKHETSASRLFLFADKTERRRLSLLAPFTVSSFDDCWRTGGH